MSLNKNWLFCLTAVAIAGNLSAEDWNSIECRLNRLEEESASRNVVQPDLQEKNTFSVSGDYLYWHAYEDGLAYGVKGQLFDGSNSNIETGEVKNLHFKRDPGFRIGVGYRMPHDNWELCAQWTKFDTDAKGASNASDEVTDLGLLVNALFSEWAPAIFTSTSSVITHIDAKWDLQLNLLDGELARYFKVTPRLALRPHGGIRGAWIKQQYKTTVNGGRINQLVLDEDRIKMTDSFKGVGLRAGIDTEWNVWKQWNLFGNAGGSLLYGTFHLRQAEKYLAVAAPESATRYNIKDEIHQIVATADLALGVRWRYTFENCWAAVLLQLGWEFNAFFDQNKFKHFDEVTLAGNYNFTECHEDLTTQGFVASARIDF